MYSTTEIFNVFKKRYERAFKGLSKLYFRNWNDNKGIEILLNLQKIDGVIISGSDYFVHNKDKATVPNIILKSKIPILGICYGFQYFASQYGHPDFVQTFRQNNYKQYSKEIIIKEPFYVPRQKYFFSHKDYVANVPKQLKIICAAKNKIYMAYNARTKYVGIQFHPERYKATSKPFFKAWLEYISASKTI